MNLLEKVVELEEDASQFGFRWECTEQIMEQIHSEYQEIDEHLRQGINADNRPALEEEIGDLLHAVFSLCVFCQFSPKETLEKSLKKFEKRMNAVKAIAQEQGLSTLDGQQFDDLMHLWKMAKERVG